MLSFHLSINVIIIVVSFKILDLCPIASFQQLWNTLYVAQTSNSWVITACNLWWYERLNVKIAYAKRDHGMLSLLLLAATVWSFAHLPLGFPIATKWCCDQDLKVVPGATFTKRTCDRCGSLEKGRVLLQPISDRVSRLGLGLETCLETRFFKSRSRSRRISVSVSSS